MYKDSDLESELRKIVRIPAVLDNVIDTLNSDLYSGPCYRNKYGEAVSMWDDEPGIHQFDFTRGVTMVSEWLDNLPSTLYYESWSGCFLTSEPEGWEDEETGEWIEPDYSEYYEIDHATMLNALVGTELAAYLY